MGCLCLDRCGLWVHIGVHHEGHRGREASALTLATPVDKALQHEVEGCAHCRAEPEELQRLTLKSRVWLRLAHADLRFYDQAIRALRKAGKRRDLAIRERQDKHLRELVEAVVRGEAEGW